MDNLRFGGSSHFGIHIDLNGFPGFNFFPILVIKGNGICLDSVGTALFLNGGNHLEKLLGISYLFDLHRDFSIKSIAVRNYSNFLSLKGNSRIRSFFYCGDFPVSTILRQIILTGRGGCGASLRIFVPAFICCSILGRVSGVRSLVVSAVLCFVVRIIGSIGIIRNAFSDFLFLLLHAVVFSGGFIRRSLFCLLFSYGIRSCGFFFLFLFFGDSGLFFFPLIRRIGLIFLLLRFGFGRAFFLLCFRVFLFFLLSFFF